MAAEQLGQSTPSGWRTLPGRLLERASSALLETCIRRARITGERRAAKDQLRTLWGITPILTLPLKAHCDRALGFGSETLVFTTYYTTRNFTWNLRWLLRLSRLLPRSERALCRIILALALLRYDIFHVFADRGIMPSLGRFGIAPEELDALSRAGRDLYVFGYGADVRTRAATLGLGGWNFCRDCDAPGRHCICDDAIGRQSMDALVGRVTALVSQGDMLTYMPGARNLAYWPIDTQTLWPAATVPRRPIERRLRIAHAPNHSHFKGTKYLEASIARLAGRGIAIDLVQTSGVPNDQVLALFADCDLVADQFIGGAYGYAALEAMASAKPVLSFVRAAELVVAADECPLLNATPDTLDAVLEWCAAHRDQLPAIGIQGRAYVERHHSIAAVAARFARLYLDTARLPAATIQRLQAFIVTESARLAAGPATGPCSHPFVITATTQTPAFGPESRRA
jgi:hypothetical protein